MYAFCMVVVPWKTFPREDRWTADLSTTLLRSSGRDDKGKRGAARESGCQAADRSTALRSGRTTFPGKDRWTADLSTPLLRSSGRDDKGEGGASIECGCRTEPIFHHLGRAKAHNFSGRDDKGDGRYSPQQRSGDEQPSPVELALSVSCDHRGERGCSGPSHGQNPAGKNAEDNRRGNR